MSFVSISRQVFASTQLNSCSVQHLCKECSPRLLAGIYSGIMFYCYDYTVIGALFRLHDTACMLVMLVDCSCHFFHFLYGAFFSSIQKRLEDGGGQCSDNAVNYMYYLHNFACLSTLVFLHV